MERKLIRNGLIISMLALTSILIVPTIEKKSVADTTEKNTVSETDDKGVQLIKSVGLNSEDEENPIITTNFNLTSNMNIRTNIVIALDVSYSMVWDGKKKVTDKYDTARNAIEKMLVSFRNSDKLDNCNVGLVMFSDSCVLKSDIKDIKQLATKNDVKKNTDFMNNLHSTEYPNLKKGNTNYEDALKVSNDMLQDYCKKNSVRNYIDNNTIILITDGIATRSNTIKIGGRTEKKGAFHASVDGIYESYKVKEQGTNVITVGYELGAGNSSSNDNNIKIESTDKNDKYYIHTMRLNKVKKYFKGQDVDFNRVLDIYKLLSREATQQKITSAMDAHEVNKRMADIILEEIASTNPNTKKSWYYKDVKELDIANNLEKIVKSMSSTTVTLEDSIPKEMNIVQGSIKCPTGVKYEIIGNRIIFTFGMELLSGKTLNFSFNTVLNILNACQSVGLKSGDYIYTNGSSIKQPNLNSTYGSSKFSYLGNELKLVSPTLKMTFDEELNECNITYDTKDGVFSYKPEDTYTIGKDYPLPTNVTRGDLKFAGWFYDEMCTKPVENNILPKTTRGNVKLYARWAATITYNSQISYFTDDISDKTVVTKDNILDIQNKYTSKIRTQTYYVGTPGKLYADSPSKGMKLMNFSDDPFDVKTWEPWSYCFGWYVNNLGSSQGPFKEISSITNSTYLTGYYPWTGNVTLQARYLGKIYHIYLHTNNKDMKINDPDWVQIEDTLWEKKYTDNKYNYEVGYEYRYRNNVYQLPSDDSVELKNGVFSGWYDNSECLGKTVTATDRNTGDDKHYYASTLDIAPIVDDNEYTEQVGDSLVLYIYATGKIIYDINGNPYDTVMTPAVEQRRKFSFYIDLPEDTKNTFVWLSPTDKKIEMKKGNANIEHANYHAFFNIKPETEVLGWPCYIDSVADVVTGNVSNSSVNESTNNNSKNNNGKKNNSNSNSSSSNILKGLKGLDMEIHTLNGTGKKKVTFTCPSDAKLMNFIGANGSKVLYLHVATAGGKYSIYKVNLVNKVMFELH